MVDEGVFGQIHMAIQTHAADGGLQRIAYGAMAIIAENSLESKVGMVDEGVVGQIKEMIRTWYCDK